MGVAFTRPRMGATFLNNCSGERVDLQVGRVAAGGCKEGT